MNPRASAPALAQASASGRFVMPQILTRGFISGSIEQWAKRLSGGSRLHEVFADERLRHAVSFESVKVPGAPNAALAHQCQPANAGEEARDRPRASHIDGHRFQEPGVDARP